MDNLTDSEMYAVIETLTNIHDIIKNAWGEDTIKLRRIQVICKEFREGRRNSFERKAGSGRKKDPLRVENINNIKNLIEQDSKPTTRQIADQMELSKDMVLRILKEDLLFTCVSDKWVPHELTENNKIQRVECFHDIIENFL